MNVGELMQSRVAKAQADQRLDAVVALMREHECGCVVVVDQDSRPVGIVTDRDVCLAALRSGQPLAAIPVATAMSGKLFRCRVDDPVDDAERAMGLHQVRRLPAVDADGRLRGLIALDDIARAAWTDAELLAPPVSCAAVGKTLGEIVRPRLVESG